MPNEHILVLEDHPELLEQVSQVLSGAGYQVVSAQTGAEALALARRSSFDLLLADVFLPDTTGIQVFQQVRATHSEMAGVVITGHSTWELALDALRAGFVAFLVKPVVPEELLATIVTALEQEKLKRENARLRTLVPLYELSRAFMETVELKDLLNQIVTAVQQETHSKVASLMLLDEDTSELKIAAAAGLARDVIEKEKQALGRGIAGYVAKTGEPMMVAEGLTLMPEVQRAMSKPDILSALSLPLRLRGQVIGVLNLSRMRGSQPFTHSDLEVATVFAGQAAIAIDKARLINQLKQLSNVSQRLATTVDLHEAYSVILNAPIETINARGVALWLNEGGSNLDVKTIGLDNVPAEDLFARREVIGFMPDGDSGWMTVPLRHGDKALGALTVRLSSANPISDERREILQTIAHVAGAVLESHRLRARESLAFREVDRAVRADMNLQDLLDRLLAEMIGTCEAEGGSIFLWDNEHGGLVKWVTQGTILEEPELVQQIIHEPYARPLTNKSNQFVIGAPMATGHRIDGAVVLVRAQEKGTFRNQQIDLLSTLTSAAALVVRNAQLYARSEEAAIAEERTRIAREIHDGLAQDLSYLVMKISVAQKLSLSHKDKELRKELNDVSEQLRRDARDVRRIIFALRPLEIETQGFLPALQKFVKEYGTVNDIEMSLHLKGDMSRLPPKLETALFRLTQEALNNIRKHAQAKHVQIDLSLESNHVALLRVRDDGCGFDLEKASQAARVRGSVGLVQMRERAERSGGTFNLRTAPGKGTLIQVQLPIRET
ncbi:MAG: GAF domain-containing protein [Chloroflexi bacterium]|nr:GAF domain-containing protein [Chloroflexota bacterium]